MSGEGSTSGPNPTAGPTDPHQPTDPTNPTNPPQPQGGSISNPQTGLCLAVDSQVIHLSPDILKSFPQQYTHQAATPHDYSNVMVDSCNDGRCFEINDDEKYV